MHSYLNLFLNPLHLHHFSLFFDNAFDEDRNISEYMQGRLEEITGLDMTYAENLQVNPIL